VKYACIAAHRDSARAEHRAYCPVIRMCELLEVSPAGFYAAEARHRAPLGPRAQANQRLQLEIRAVHRASKESYGAPMIHRELREQGVACGRHRVARLMRQQGLRGLCRQKFRVTTQSTHREPIAPNLVAQRFAPGAFGGSNRVWGADITYLSTREGWLYLAVVLDLASRRVIGWCAARTLEHSLALRALQQAFVVRFPAPGLIHHSDRGVQYASAAYQAVLTAHGAIPSMSRRGNCWDNAVVESFFATLKTDLVARTRWVTRAEAHRDLGRWLNWYNMQRRHSALGYISPYHYERDRLQLRRA
jgi:putative transposase